MSKAMVNRYSFYAVFSYNPQTTNISPNVNILINGVSFPAHSQIPRGQSFGGLDLYALMGKDVAGIWDQLGNRLTIVGFY